MLGVGRLLICIALAVHALARGKVVVRGALRRSLRGDERLLDIRCEREAVLMVTARRLWWSGPWLRSMLVTALRPGETEKPLIRLSCLIRGFIITVCRVGLEPTTRGSRVHCGPCRLVRFCAVCCQNMRFYRIDGLRLLSASARPG